MANILVVDDDQDLVDVLSSVLEELGHDVRVALDGREGLSALDEAIPDVIILDIEMPVLDGPGMAHEILVHNAGRERIPIILISGYVDLELIAARIGTPYVTRKPCTLDMLLGLLDRALRERTPPRPPVPPEPRRSPGG